jgi:hypothetical protein
VPLSFKKDGKAITGKDKSEDLPESLISQLSVKRLQVGNQRFSVEQPTFEIE